MGLRWEAGAPGRVRSVKLEYKWIVLVNTTIGMLMASINQTIVLISLPAIFSGLHVDPLAPGAVEPVAVDVVGLLGGHHRSTGYLRTDRRHVRPSLHLQPGLGRLHDWLATLRGNPFSRDTRRDRTDRFSDGSGVVPAYLPTASRSLPTRFQQASVDSRSASFRSLSSPETWLEQCLAASWPRSTGASTSLSACLSA